MSFEWCFFTFCCTVRGADQMGLSSVVQSTWAIGFFHVPFFPHVWALLLCRIVYFPFLRMCCVCVFFFFNFSAVL